MVYADLLRPRTRSHGLVFDLILIVSGSLIVALSALLEIRLPFTPVPITAQTLAVLLVGALLGSRRGALSLAVYLGEGAAGLPVFAGGRAGAAYMLGPTGGYLLGFVGAAWLTGWLAERGWDRRAWTAFLAMLSGNLVIYLLGTAWLSTLVGPAQALALGVAPFLAGDLLKIALGTALLPLGWEALRRLGMPIG